MQYAYRFIMKDFFISLKTTVWTLVALIALFFIGSYMMPAYREVFGPMNSALLFEWAAEAGARHLWQTWWFFASVAALVILTINTLVCSIQTVKGRWTRRDFLLRISPQIIHIGFLFILLAHLMGAVWGYRLSGVMPEGAFARLPEDRGLYLREIRAKVDDAGYLTDWSAEVYVFEDGKRVKAGMLGPNSPLFYKGTGVYLKSLAFEAGPSAVLMVNKDPGAIWALVGAVLFAAGSVILLVIKWEKA